MSDQMFLEYLPEGGVQLSWSTPSKKNIYNSSHFILHLMLRFNYFLLHSGLNDCFEVFKQTNEFYLVQINTFVLRGFAMC